MRNSVSTRNSALKFRFMRNSAVQMWKSVPILRINTELRIEIPLDAEYWNKFSASCGIPLYVNIYELLWNRMENSPHLTFFVFFNLFVRFSCMRKWRSNTPHENFRTKYAENKDFCGNLG